MKKLSPSLEKGKRWKELLAKGKVHDQVAEEALHGLRRQALRAVANIYPVRLTKTVTSTVPADSDDETQRRSRQVVADFPNDVWQKHVEAVKKLKPVWDAKRNEFVAGGGDTAKAPRTATSEGETALPPAEVEETKETDPAHGGVSDGDKTTDDAIAILFDALITAHDSVYGKSVYGEKDITIKGVKAGDEGKVEIRFAAPLESMYYCPGANAKTTEKGVELTFVRSYMKKKPKVTYPATFVRKPNQPVEAVIAVTANGKSMFLRDGEKLIQLYPVPTTQAATQLPTPDAERTGIIPGPKGTRLYVTCAASKSTVAVVDAASGKTIASIPTGN